MAVLIDSSVWITWLRNKTDPRDHIKPWILRRSCFSCGIIRMEVVRGILDRRQREKVEGLFDTLEDIPLSIEFWISATQRAWELDRKGIVLPISDLVIAECARKTGAWLVSEDQHFSKVPGLKLRKTLPQIERR